MNDPRPITPVEWREIMDLSGLGDAWGVTSDDSPELCASVAHGACFDFMSSPPGYYGALYVVIGDEIDLPFVLIRDKGTGALSDVSRKGWAPIDLYELGAAIERRPQGFSGS
jgi:hypothetical protein